MSDELVWKSAVELAGLIRDGETSSVEVVEAHLARIDEVNPSLNAIVTLTAELALEGAAKADQLHAEGGELGLLHGLPIAHKDLADTKGILTTAGSPVLANNVPDNDALVVERAVQAGAITVGKTNTPQYGAGSQTFNEVFGATKNPYDTTKTCGGSSGGAATALASAMVPLADGSDMGGSLRNPAAFCNIVGFRPSPGRVPAWPKTTAWSHLSTEGPMGRTVDDVALLLAAQAGEDLRSPIALAGDGREFVPPIGEPAGALRVAWAPTLGGLPIAADVTTALAHVPDVFAGLGHNIDEASPDLTGAGEVFDVLRAVSFATTLSDEYEHHRDVLKDTVIWNVERGHNVSIDDQIRATKMRRDIYQRTVRFFDEFDVLLCPTAQVAPFDLDTEWIEEIEGHQMQTYIEWMRVATDVTIMNCPAISVPAGFTDDGLPIGLQIVCAPRADLAVLEVAKQFETATQVGQRRPTL